MQSKKYLALFAVSLIILWGFLIPSTYAQQSDSNKDQIPSDLALDLELAQKNPAPNQEQIAQVQTEKAQITTSQGEKVDLPIKETVPDEIKTQSAKDAVNPAQTTSEQVVEKNVQEPVSQPQSSDNLPGTNTLNDSQKDNNQAGKNMIPGTNIQEPDDNSAPPLTPSTPDIINSAPQPAVSEPNTNTPSSSPGTAPVNSQDNNSPSSSIPLENGSTQATSTPAPRNEPTSAPAENNPPAENPPADNSSQPPADTSNVEGVSSVSWWQIFINQVSKIFK